MDQLTPSQRCSCEGVIQQLDEMLPLFGLNDRYGRYSLLRDSLRHDYRRPDGNEVPIAPPLEGLTAERRVILFRRLQRNVTNLLQDFREDGSTANQFYVVLNEFNTSQPTGEGSPESDTTDPMADDGNVGDVDQLE